MLAFLGYPFFLNLQSSASPSANFTEYRQAKVIGAVVSDLFFLLSSALRRNLILTFHPIFLVCLGFGYE
jgi:hypothetical protein